MGSFQLGKACWLRRCRPADRLRRGTVSLLSVDHALKAGDAEAKGDSVCGLGAVIAVAVAREFLLSGESDEPTAIFSCSRNQG